MKQLLLAIPIHFLFFTIFAQNQKPLAITDSVRNAVLKNIYHALGSYYVYPDKASLMVAYLKEQDEKGSYRSFGNPNEFAARVARDLRLVYNDKHLRIEYNPSLEKDILKFLASKKERCYSSRLSPGPKPHVGLKTPQHRTLKDH